MKIIRIKILQQRGVLNNIERVYMKWWLLKALKKSYKNISRELGRASVGVDVRKWPRRLGTSHFAIYAKNRQGLQLYIGMFFSVKWCICHNTQNTKISHIYVVLSNKENKVMYKKITKFFTWYLDLSFLSNSLIIIVVVSIGNKLFLNKETIILRCAANTRPQ